MKPQLLTKSRTWSPVYLGCFFQWHVQGQLVAVMQSAMQSALDQISAGTGLLGLGILFPTIWYTSSHIETVHRLQTMDLAQTHN